LLQATSPYNCWPLAQYNPEDILLLNTGKPGPQRETYLVPASTPSWTPPNFTVTTFIEGYSHSDPGRSDTAGDFLRSHPTTDVVVWTDGSVSFPLGAGGASIHAVCRRCSSSSSLSYSAGLVSSSFSAKSSALAHGLEWCYSHLKSCHFQSALFLTDCQSAFTILSSAPAFLQPKSF